MGWEVSLYFVFLRRDTFQLKVIDRGKSLDYIQPMHLTSGYKVTKICIMVDLLLIYLELIPKKNH